MFPEQLYLPTAHDYAVGIAPRRFLLGESQRLTAAVSITVEPPPVAVNTMLLIEHVQLSAAIRSGAVEFLTYLFARILAFPAIYISSGALYHAEGGESGALGRSHRVAFTTGVYLLPGERLQIQAGKNAAVETMFLDYTIAGWILPRANIQTG